MEKGSGKVGKVHPGTSRAMAVGGRTHEFTCLSAVLAKRQEDLTGSGLFYRYFRPEKTVLHILHPTRIRPGDAIRRRIKLHPR